MLPVTTYASRRAWCAVDQRQRTARTVPKKARRMGRRRGRGLESVQRVYSAQAVSDFYLGLRGIKWQERRSTSKTTEELSHAPSSIHRPLGFSFSLNRIRVACRRRSGPLLSARAPVGLSRQLPVLKPSSMLGDRVRYRCPLRAKSALCLRTSKKLKTPAGDEPTAPCRPGIHTSQFAISGAQQPGAAGTRHFEPVAGSPTDVSASTSSQATFLDTLHRRRTMDW